MNHQAERQGVSLTYFTQNLCEGEALLIVVLRSLQLRGCRRRTLAHLHAVAQQPSLVIAAHGGLVIVPRRGLMTGVHFHHSRGINGLTAVTINHTIVTWRMANTLADGSLPGSI